MSLTEDLAVFVSDFGDDALLDGQPVRGIFDAPAATQGLGSMAVAASEPQLQLPTSSVPAAVFGKVLQVLTGRGAGSYTVREHLSDGAGMSLLLLTEA